MKKLVFLLSILSNITFAQTMNFEIQGHRGCRGLLPENTIPAFKKAIDIGVNTLELDLVISKDKKVVVSHDPFFNPDCTTDPKGNFITASTMENLYLLDYKQIKKYDVGSRGNKKFPEQKKMKAYKPLLVDMIRECEKYAKSKGIKPLNYNIEIKSLETEYDKTQPQVAEFSELVYAILSKELPLERITLQSFDANILKYWHKEMQEGKYKKVILAWLIEDTDDNDVQVNLDKLGFKPDVWSPYFKTLNSTRVKQLHDLNIKIIPWTVNERKDMEAIKALGCDGLITDYPNRAIDLKQ